MTNRNGTKIRKAVIAAAGFGTRFLPQTKAMPKEMLPIVDKPIIQYVVEELVDAGIEDIVLVTGYHKRSVEDHFDNLSADLSSNLKKAGKLELLEQTKTISNLANFVYVRQKGPYGSASPIINVEHLIGDEPFIYTYADDLITAKPNRFKQTIDLYNELQGAILPCIRAETDADFERYGILSGKEIKTGVIKVNNIVEKPGRKAAPSDFASVGGYILPPTVFKYAKAGLKHLKEDQEFYLSTFALEPMIKAGEPVYACLIKDSKYYDTGNKLEYLKTVVDFALMHDDLKDEFKRHLKDLT
jgi:UTP--glucose-1-phosphate uridylyltransferase